MALSTPLQSLRVGILGTLAAAVIKLLSLTIRWERRGFERPELHGAGTAPCIFAFWHGRMLMAPGRYKALRRRRLGYMLISRHGDGRIIATAIRLLGIRSIAGSSSRGGMAALREMVRRANEGHDLGITPDGPRGPRYVCKDGVVSLALLSGRTIYPFSYSTERVWQLKSWDGMIIPRPFSRGVAIFGAPISVSRDENPESARKRIQDALNDVTEQADRYWRSR